MACSLASKFESSHSNHEFSALAAQDDEALKHKKIKSIVSILRDYQPSFPEIFNYLVINCDDLASANLIMHFSQTTAWIENALERGNVLVHCQAGVSRSPSIIAAYLMEKEGWERNRCLEFIQTQKQGWVHPNEGFMNQLNWYAEMGFKIDGSSKGYRLWMAERMAAWKAISVKQGLPLHFFPEYSDLAELDLSNTSDNTEHLVNSIGVSEAAKEQNNQPTIQTKQAQMPRGKQSYKCRKCRNFLFTEDQVTQHEVGTKGQCTLYFVEPLDWIAGIVRGNMDGKVECPKCHFKMGNWAWSGMPCSCGTWVAPGFGIAKQKVDLVKSIV